jgi:hypothetical protein
MFASFWLTVLAVERIEPTAMCQGQCGQETPEYPHGGSSGQKSVALWTSPVRYFVATEKGWPVLLTDAQPLAWSAQIVSEHTNG